MLSAVPADPAEWLRPAPLRGRFIALEPLTTDHAAGLCAGADASTVEFLARGGPQENTPQEWAAYIERLTIPGRVNWAMLDTSGAVLGRISYSEVRPADRWVEIGTMLLPIAQGTSANPEAKLLLLTRAFEELGAGRVHFKVDSRNARSLRAMEKLGAVREGTLRRYQVRPDGYARDSVMFSILADEWAGVKAGLEARLGAYPAR
ncbi:MAG: GNAT family protein [Deinococcus sp.]|uniref:GNAT family N-acetyltransferase n=1 Tax=Deinococcus sp. TaxID=47478 RepID=UPI0026DB99E2|nr:GNAT family protein [Deinococcus sp.]MDO4247074.1 GNAT family protein [Deinococcus sp.]